MQLVMLIPCLTISIICTSPFLPSDAYPIYLTSHIYVGYVSVLRTSHASPKLLML